MAPFSLSLHTDNEENCVSASTRLGDDNARMEMAALRKLSQEERLRVLIGNVAETGGTPEAQNGDAFRKRLKAQGTGRATRRSRAAD